ncbi:MAG: hypothetical protein COS95_07740 [Ignavibacteriales bacterium CG07_land_8_20_14_0_80_59_12]|nr:MAG: hypothetical protein COS95_07740 [Ignavibacteriales bacterium CG07_land_8_20_14_0_80_59_12]
MNQERTDNMKPRISAEEMRIDTEQDRVLKMEAISMTDGPHLRDETPPEKRKAAHLGPPLEFYKQ